MAQELVIRSYLKQLRLPAMAQNYGKLAREAAEANMPYEDYLLALLELETAHRVENATNWVAIHILLQGHAALKPPIANPPLLPVALVQSSVEMHVYFRISCRQ